MFAEPKRDPFKIKDAMEGALFSVYCWESVLPSVRIASFDCRMLTQYGDNCHDVLRYRLRVLPDGSFG